ncbi:DUF393 domain-containing protein [Myxococcota bacterium]|nr:DUF393 domain-containing protein [Myxococcota bacterium]
MKQNTPDLTVYFDGLCVICNAEIQHYRRRDRDGRIAFVDIAAPAFDAEAHGLDPREVVRVLHARRADGTLITGVDTFVEIWARVPGFGPAARLARLKPVRAALELGYRAFVRARPYLPRRKAGEGAACPDGRCAVG